MLRSSRAICFCNSAAGALRVSACSINLAAVTSNCLDSRRRGYARSCRLRLRLSRAGYREEPALYRSAQEAFTLNNLDIVETLVAHAGRIIELAAKPESGLQHES
jgi:hypothetical protein